MLAEHPDLPAADDVITVREELARGQTVGARQTERERERERNALSVFSFPLPSCLTFFRTLFSRPMQWFSRRVVTQNWLTGLF